MASTTGNRKPSKILSAPQAAGTSRPKGATFGSCRRDHRAPLAVTLRFYPGPEGWVTVELDGVVRWFPGSTPLVLAFMLAAGWSVANPEQSFRAP